MSVHKVQQRESARVLQLLAQGLDPQTQSRLEEGAVLQDLSVVRALFRGAEALRIMSSARSGRESSAKTRAGKPWSAQEDLRLRHSFEAGSSVSTLATTHERTRGSIRARLRRLGLIEDVVAIEGYRPVQAWVEHAAERR